MEKYLLVNAGSSSLKFALYNVPEMEEIVSGNIERIGLEDSKCIIKSNGKRFDYPVNVVDHKEAFSLMVDKLLEGHYVESLEEISSVVHRVVHGGELYSEAVFVDDEVRRNLESLVELAQLHLPAEIVGIDASKSLLPNSNVVAVFDTAFHQTIPEVNYTYAVPYSWQENFGVRKYGFHGTSCKYITETVREKKGYKNLIICHIGGGASVTCVKDGKSFDTSMGLTPLDGVVMSTRCGNIDASVVEYMCKKTNKSVEEVTELLNKNSGFYGISGVSSDFRHLDEAANKGDRRAILAKEKMVLSIVNFIAQYYFLLQGDVDALVFTAGIGENMPSFRKDVVDRISEITGARLDDEINQKISKSGEYSEGLISTMYSKLHVLVIPTDEEYQMVKEAYELIESKKNNIQRKVKN